MNFIRLASLKDIKSYQIIILNIETTRLVPRNQERVAVQSSQQLSALPARNPSDRIPVLPPRQPRWVALADRLWSNPPSCSLVWQDEQTCQIWRIVYSLIQVFCKIFKCTTWSYPPFVLKKASQHHLLVISHHFAMPAARRSWTIAWAL